MLFVNHVSRVLEAERVLLDLVGAFRGASAFLFEDGPLRPALAAAGVTSIIPAAPARAVDQGGLARVLRLAAHARRFDVVYANSPPAFALAALACALVRRPLVWHLHELPATDRFGPGPSRRIIRLARLATRVIVPSRAAAAAFETAGGHMATLRVVPTGLDDPADPSEPCGKDVLGLGPRFVFGVFGPLTPGHGQAVALHALATLPMAACVFVGGAAPFQDTYARSLVALAAELGIADRVRFLGQHHDIPVLLRAVDAVIHPATAPEPFVRTLIQAMHARRPIVASRIGAVPEILDHGRVGLLVPPGDGPALAGSLAQIMAGAADALIDPAEQHARAVYGAARMRAAVAALIAELSR